MGNGNEMMGRWDYVTYDFQELVGHKGVIEWGKCGIGLIGSGELWWMSGRIDDDGSRC